MTFNPLTGYQTGAYTYSLEHVLAKSAANTSQSTQKKNTDATRAVDKLLGELSLLLSQSLSASDAEAASTLLPDAGQLPVPQNGSERPETLDPDSIAGLLKLLGLDKPVSETGPLSPEQMKELIRQYLMIQETLNQIRETIEKLQNGEVFSDDHQALLEHLQQQQEMLEAVRDGYQNIILRFGERDWYLLWRLMFVDVFETKTNLRREMKEGKLSVRSLPEGVELTNALAAVEEENLRPDLEHVSQILQQLSQEANVDLSQEDEQALLKAWNLIQAA